MNLVWWWKQVKVYQLYFSWKQGKELQQVIWGGGADSQILLCLIYYWQYLHHSLPLLFSLLPWSPLPPTPHLPTPSFLQQPTWASLLSVNAPVTLLPSGVCDSFCLDHFSLQSPHVSLTSFKSLLKCHFSVRPSLVILSSISHISPISMISQDLFTFAF